MHPILFEIPLNWIMVAVVGVLFGIGGVIRNRYAPADRDASYLATFLGLNVQWGKVVAPWSTALGFGLMTGGLAAAIATVVKYVAASSYFNATSIPLHIYGMMMASAFIVGIWLAMSEAKHERLPSVPFTDANGKRGLIPASDFVSDLSFYLLISGLGGARLLYIFTRWESDYAQDPMRIFMFWQGGLVWYGGLIGATVTAVWFVRKHKVAFLPYGDCLVPGTSLAHAIGRLGCFAAGCCFGNVATPGFPLSVQFPPGSPAAVEHLEHGLIHSSSIASLPVYPTQIIEALGEVIICLILLKIRSRKRFHGQVLLTYFFMYAILRTVIEMFRGDSIRGFIFRWPNAEHPMLLSTSQGVSVLTATIGIALTIALVRARSRATAHHMEPRPA